MTNFTITYNHLMVPIQVYSQSIYVQKRKPV